MTPTPFPMMFYNLSGEMLYVLNQRLQAQSVAEEKSKKVLVDIISTMFKNDFLDQMFNSTTIYSKNSLKNIFKKLIHSSIMRLTDDSMNKLFDLMIMAVKYQTISCANPNLLLHICLNHLDTILKFVENDTKAKSLVIFAFNKIVQTYSQCKLSEMCQIRQKLLCFLQDCTVKITMYLTEGIQNDLARFTIPTNGVIPSGFTPPGSIRIYKDEKIFTKTFDVGGSYEDAIEVTDASLEIGGVRATKLGTNVYETNPTTVVSSADNTEDDFSESANAELDLLSQILGVKNIQLDKKHEFNIDLFSDDVEHSTKETFATSSTADKDVVNINVSDKSKNHLQKILKDFKMEFSEDLEASGDNDLLSLMDSY